MSGMTGSAQRLRTHVLLPESSSFFPGIRMEGVAGQAFLLVRVGIHSTVLFPCGGKMAFSAFHFGSISGPFLPVYRVAGRALGERFSFWGISGRTVHQVSSPAFRPHGRMATQAYGGAGLPEETFSDPSMGPVAFVASSLRETRAMNTVRPRAVLPMTTRA
jgi:hypothetical protein